LSLGQLHAQNKKEQLKLLNATIDSLNVILANERYAYSMNQKGYEDLIDSYKTEIELKSDLVSSLKTKIELNRHKADSTADVLRKEITFLKDSISSLSIKKSKKFTLPYRHGKLIDPYEGNELTTVFLNAKNKNYIITDSIASRINETDVCFYFLTPVEDELNIQCPNEYGLIILDQNNTEIYSSFWNFESTSELSGNFFYSLNEYKTNNGKRNLLSLGTSGCGSGDIITYFDVIYINRKIQFKEVFTGGSGYSEFKFIPEKNVYLKIERIDPECHYSCPSKYEISSYSLSTDVLLKSTKTKLIYEDYNDIGIEALLKIIQQKEGVVIY
jgi:hypothetical protein